MNNNFRDDMITEIRLMREKLDRMENILNRISSNDNDKSMMLLDPQVLMMEDLREVYNFIGENKGKYSKAKGYIWDVDLRSVFNDMGLENEWDNCIAAMKRLGVLNRGKDLTIVAKVNGKSKRLYRVNMSRMQDYLKGAFKDC